MWGRKILEESFNIKWQNTQREDTITVSKIFFEHLLNCLANQHFISELSPEMQKENQEAIDKAWREGMFIHGLNVTMTLAHKKMFEKYCEFWNKSIPLIQEHAQKDLEEHTGDTNITFKWGHLVAQEIEMWMRLCCFLDSVIDCKNEKYTPGNVSLEDFNYIVTRRGFTTRMRDFLIDILKDVGIGEKLNKETK